MSPKPRKFQLSTLFLVAILTLAVPSVVSPVAKADTLPRAYAFAWAPELSGYGGYRATVADLDGDGFGELLMTATVGEREGQEPPPPSFLAVYRDLEEIGRVETDEGLAGVADLDGDGDVEVLTWDRPAEPGGSLRLAAWRWDTDSSRLVSAPAELLDAYRDRGGVLPGDLEAVPGFLGPPASPALPQDVDGDGLLDGMGLVIRDAGADLLLRTTKGERRVSINSPRTAAGGAWDVAVEAWRPEGRPGWPHLFVSWVDPDRSLVQSLWAPAGDGYRRIWEETVSGPSGPYHLAPAVALLDLDGDGLPERVLARKGVIEVSAWTGDGFRVLARTPDHGGLGYAAFHAADLDGDGIAELVARHVSPNLYTHNLKIYELRGERLEGLADLRDVGSQANLPGLLWRTRPATLLLLPRSFERARPEGLAFAAVFQDSRGHWAEPAILRGVLRGFVHGYPDGSFQPDRPVTRAEWVKLLVAALGLEPAPGAPARFEDVAGHWAQEQGWFEAAEAAGILVPGEDGAEGRFDPDAPAERRWAAAPAVRAVEGGGDVERRAEKLHDVEGYIVSATEVGLFKGYPDGEFHPDRALTRAEALTVVERVLAIAGGSLAR